MLRQQLEDPDLEILWLYRSAMTNLARKMLSEDRSNLLKVAEVFMERNVYTSQDKEIMGKQDMFERRSKLILTRVLFSSSRTDWAHALGWGRLCTTRLSNTHGEVRSVSSRYL